MADPVAPQPPAPVSILATITGAAGSAIATLTSPKGAVAILFAAVAGWFILQEWNRDPVLDVARAWNTSIERLGIRPLYPPREDFHVGDVMAVISLRHPQDEASLSLAQRALINKAIRIGHVDLSGRLREVADQRPRYAASPPPAPPAASGGGRVEPPPVQKDTVTWAGGRTVDLSAMLFPAVVITVERGFSLSGLWAAVTGRAALSRNEIITIVKPRTYGIAAQDGVGYLFQHCFGEAADNPNCAREQLRYILSLNFGPSVCDRFSNGDPVFDISIMLVTEAFLSQDIQVGVDRQRLIRLEDQRVPPTSSASSEQPSKGPSGIATAGPAFPDSPGARAYDQMLVASSGKLDTLTAFGFQAVSIVARDIKPKGSLSCAHQ